MSKLIKFKLLLILTFSILLSCGSQEERTYQITVTAVPTEAGTVTPESAVFEEGRKIEVSATPAPHWVFLRWEGDLEGTGNPASVTIDSDKEIAAIFEKRDYPLTVTVSGEGEVEEEIVVLRTTEYSHGTAVKLTAVPSDGWVFFEWRGDVVGEESEIVIQIEGETVVEAVFSKIEYPLTISIIGEGRVEENVVASRTTEYEEGTLVELTAIAEENWIFSSWSGDISSQESVEMILIDGPKSVTAEFLRTFKLITIANPAEGGSVDPSSGNFVRDLSFDVTANANQGWRFSRWEGDFTGTVNPFNLTMNGNKTITALFERLAYSLTIDMVGQGDVTKELISGSETDEGYLFESEVRLTATPNIGWRFVRWEGDINSGENPLTVVMDDDISVRALFSFFEGGTGTAEDPYQISTLNQLNEIRSDPGASFILLNDIDASATALWDSGLGFLPVGTVEEPFTGSLNGNGFEIQNLMINRPDQIYAGFFGVLEGSTGELTLENITVSGDDRVGGLAGSNLGDISNVTVNGSVTGNNFTGGITGQNSGTLENISSSVQVNGADHTGGISGSNEGSILLSHSSGDVIASGFRTGGLIGVNSGTVGRSSASGTVTAGSVTGGIAGWNRLGGMIEFSFASGTVTGGERTGGFVGRHDDSDSKIVNSYARGNVEGSSGVGGFAGTVGLNAVIEYAYSAGTVAGTEDLGGFAGRNAGTLIGGYWDTTVSGLAGGVGLGSDDGVTGLLSPQMTGAEAEENMSAFDWDSIWRIVVGGYPVLFWME